MELRVLIGLNIRYQRKLIGMSQEVLARTAGIDRGSMGKIENAKYAISVDKLEQITKALGLEPSILVTPPNEFQPLGRAIGSKRR